MNENILAVWRLSGLVLLWCSFVPLCVHVAGHENARRWMVHWYKDIWYISVEIWRHTFPSSCVYSLYFAWFLRWDHLGACRAVVCFPQSVLHTFISDMNFLGWCTAQCKLLLYFVWKPLWNIILNHLAKEEEERTKTSWFGTYVMFFCATRRTCCWSWKHSKMNGTLTQRLINVEILRYLYCHNIVCLHCPYIESTDFIKII